jgi:hypothetical protein
LFFGSKIKVTQKINVQKIFLTFAFHKQGFKLNAFIFKKKCDNMSYELTGKLLEKFETIQRTETFKIREFVVEKSEEINGKTITNFIKFQSVQDKTAIIDRINVGDEIKVHFNIRGSKWNKDGRVSYFNNLDAWRIEQILQPGEGTTPGNNEYLEPLDTFTSASENTIDDLPF